MPFDEKEYYLVHKNKLNRARATLYNVHKYGLDPDMVAEFRANRRLYRLFIKNADILNLAIIERLLLNFAKDSRSKPDRFTYLRP